MRNLTAIRIGSIIALLFALIISGVLSNAFLCNSTTSFHNQIDSLKIQISNKNWGTAKETLDNLEKDWESKKPLWTALTDHKKMDVVEFHFVRIKDYVKNKDSTPAIVELNLAAEQFECITKGEELTFGNIF